MRSLSLLFPAICATLANFATHPPTEGKKIWVWQLSGDLSKTLRRGSVKGAVIGSRRLSMALLSMTKCRGNVAALGAASAAGILAVSSQADFGSSLTWNS